MAYINIKSKKDNRDPVTNEPGAHLIGSGVGSAVGATTVFASIFGLEGLSFAAIIEPVGIMLSAGLGGLAGGLTGKWIAENLNPTSEQALFSEYGIYQ